MPGPLVCSSQLTHVTVYARGALVTRQVRPPQAAHGPTSALASAPDGEIDLVVEDLTPLAEPGSIRAAIVAANPAHGTTVATSSGSGRQIVAVRSVLHIPETTAEPGPSAARVQELGLRIARVQAEVERLQQQRQKLAKSVPDPALRTTSFVEKVDERIADALATAELLHESLGRVNARLGGLERELAELQLALAAAELEHRQARSSQTTGQGHPSRRVIIRVSGAGALPELTLSYVVPAARFWPLYTLRITDARDGKESSRRATWMIEALVAQRSGEDWREVRLSLSTADILLDARLPELPSLRLGRAQPPPRRGYRPPPAGLDELFTGYDRWFREIGQPQPALRQEPMPMTLSLDRGQDVLESTAPEFPEAPAEQRFSPQGHGGYSSTSGGLVGSLPPPGAAPPAPKSGSAMNFAAPMLEGGPSPSMSAPAMPPPVMSAPMMMRSRRASNAPARGGGPPRDLAKKERELAATLSDGLGGGGGYGGMMEEDADDGAAPSSVEPQDNWLDFDRLVLSGPDGRSRRGRLARTSESATLPSARLANEQIESLRPADGLCDPMSSRGHFDHRYDADGLMLVPSDGLPHRVAISSSDTLPSLRLLSVPGERAEVYREAELKNPSEAPLLAGPVEVYVEGSLLTTAAISAIDRGGALNVGMGVEERVRVARNVRSDEENVGLLGGSTQVTHNVSIELSSALGQQAVVEVFERLPISDDKSVTIELLSSRPEPREYTQAERGSPVRGGLVWRLLLPSGGKAKIDYQFRILFPARTEIVGGNRRD